MAIMLAKLTKYGLIGVANAIIDFCFYLFFIYFFSVNPILSHIWAWFCAVQFSYVMNSLITFKQNKYQLASLKKWFLFILSGVVALGASTLTLALFLPYMGIYGAKIMATIASFLVGFLLSNYIVFKERK